MADMPAEVDISDPVANPISDPVANAVASPAADPVGLVAFHGTCIGRRTKGKRILFLDLIQYSGRPSATCSNSSPPPAWCLPSDALPQPKAPNLTGAQVMRARPLTLGDILAANAGQPQYNVYVALHPNSLDQRAYDRLAGQLNPASLPSPCFSKPRIGDVFAIRGRLAPTSDRVVNGRAVKGVNAVAVELIRRGQPPRPADNADKWSWDPSKPQRRGRPVRSRSRFEVFAKWCVATFHSRDDVADITGTGRGAVLPRLRVLDVAGGGGKLSAELAKLGCASTIIDPRAIPAPPVDGARTRPATRPARIEAAFDSTAHAAVARECDVLLGLHCDGAVDQIVAAASDLQKSFAIVACCVFPTQFKRRLSDGTPVVEREELNRWIVEDCRRRGYRGTLSTEVLAGFEGANVCVFGLAAK